MSSSRSSSMSSRSSMSSTSPSDTMSRPRAARAQSGFSPFASIHRNSPSDISSARSAFKLTPAGQLQKNRRTFSLFPRANSSLRMRSDPTSRRARRPRRRSRNVSLGGSRRVKRGGAPILILGGSRRVKGGQATLRPTTINSRR